MIATTMSESNTGLMVNPVYTVFTGDDMPVFTGQTWEEHVSTWHEVFMDGDARKWYLGAILHSVKEKFGKDMLMKFAGDVGLKGSTIYQYLRTHRRFQECARAHSLSWSHHRIAAYQKTPEDTERVLQLAEDNNWTAETMQKTLRGTAAKEALPQVIDNGSDEDRKWWEERARPLLYMLAQERPKYKRVFADAIDEINNSFKMRAMRPIDMAGQHIQEGARTAQDVSARMYVSVEQAQVLINELEDEGKIRKQKASKVTTAARGATVDEYFWNWPIEAEKVEDEPEDDEDI